MWDTLRAKSQTPKRPIHYSPNSLKPQRPKLPSPNSVRQALTRRYREVTQRGGAGYISHGLHHLGLPQLPVRAFLVIPSWNRRSSYIHSQADGVVQLSSDAESDFREVLEENLEGPNHAPATAASRRGREFKKGKGAKVLRWNRFRKIREKLGLFLAGSSRASQGPITLSDVLIPEQEGSAEITQTHFGGLF